MVFALLFLAAAGSARAQFDLPGGGFGDGGFGSMPGAEAQHAKVAAQFAVAKDGKPARLFITATIESKWYTYSITQKPGGPQRTQIIVAPSKGFRLTGPFVSDPPPEAKPEELFDNLVVEKHKGTVIWYAPLEFAAGVDPAKLEITGKVQMQLCADACVDETHAWTARLGPRRRRKGAHGRGGETQR